MDRDVIKELIEALAASDLAELEYRSNGETLKLVKRGAGMPAPARPTPPPATDQTPVVTPKRPSAPEPGGAIPDTIVTPLYGIVHLQQMPGAPPLVGPGQSVTAGQLVCVIEAMKVFNQVRAERDCVIAAVLVHSGQEVEAGQPLFRLAEVSINV
jgi:acetyl-CoA carboxylase biotin carboxyl carrier protein